MLFFISGPSMRHGVAISEASTLLSSLPSPSLGVFICEALRAWGLRNNCPWCSRKFRIGFPLVSNSTQSLIDQPRGAASASSREAHKSPHPAASFRMRVFAINMCLTLCCASCSSSFLASANHPKREATSGPTVTIFEGASLLLPRDPDSIGGRCPWPFEGGK